MRTRTYVTASAVVGILAVTVGLDAKPAQPSDMWPAYMRGHIVDFGPAGVDAAEIRTNLTAGDPLAVEVCQRALTGVAGAMAVRVLGVDGGVVASGTVGVCRAEPRV